MTVPIGKLRGTIPSHAAALKQMGYKNSDRLLEAARKPAGRNELADRLGVDSRHILHLANRADLARIKGIGAVFADLLEKAGVDTVPELAARNPANLYTKMMEVNRGYQLAKQMPTQTMIEHWVARAKELPRMIEY